MKQALAGVVAFFVMGLLSVIGFYSVQHYTLVDQLTRNLTGQCVVLEDRVIKAAVDEAVAEVRAEYAKAEAEEAEKE